MRFIFVFILPASVMERTLYPFSTPLYIMTKPAGSRCNLACDYCYYLEKKHLYKGEGSHFMSDGLLERFIEQYINAQSVPEVLFNWHGGETLLRPLDFYRRAVQLQQKYADGRRIVNAIQTNGTLLDDDWCRFFKENGWLVGVSIDGPQRFHDQFRRDPQGNPSFRRVLHGIQLLGRHDVAWNAMAVVNRFNAGAPVEFYRFFKTIRCRYIQFTPIVEREFPHADGRHLASPDDEAASVTETSVSAEQWGDFLCRLFDQWVVEDVGKYYIQLFDSVLANWMGMEPGVCTMARSCGHAGVMEFNGDVYSCDHFVFPEFKLGNLDRQPLLEMMYSEKQLAFGRRKHDALPAQCRRCPFLFACNGECPKNRFLTTEDGEPGLNYLCKGYLRFFEHVAPYMEFMKAEFLAHRPPANVMKAIRAGFLPAPSRNR